MSKMVLLAESKGLSGVPIAPGARECFYGIYLVLASEAVGAWSKSRSAEDSRPNLKGRRWHRLLVGEGGLGVFGFDGFGGGLGFGGVFTNGGSGTVILDGAFHEGAAFGGIFDMDGGAN